MKNEIDSLLIKGKTEEAQKYMDKMIVEKKVLGDELLMVHSNLALQLKDINKAVNLLKKVGNKNEKLFIESRLQLARIYLYIIKDRRLFTFCFKEILSKYNTFENYKLAGKYHLEGNMPEDAIFYYKQSLEYLKNSKIDVEVYKNYGKALVQNNNYNEAIEYYQKYTSIFESKSNDDNLISYWEFVYDYIELLLFLSQNKYLEQNEQLKKKKNLSNILDDYHESISISIYNSKKTQLKFVFAYFLYVAGLVKKQVYIITKKNDILPEILYNINDANKQINEVLNEYQKNEDTDLTREKELYSNILFELGNYYQNLDKKNTVKNYEKYYIQSIEQNQHNFSSLLSICKFYLKKNKFKDCLDYLKLLLLEDESNSEALSLLVLFLNSYDNIEISLNLLDNIITEKPNAYHIIEYYIELLKRQGKLSYANDILYKNEKKLKLNFSPGLYYCKGLYNRYMGEIVKALEEFTNAKYDDYYQIKCLQNIIELYMNPDGDPLIINFDLPWRNKENNESLLKYNTENLLLDDIKDLINQLKKKKDDYKIIIYESYLAILSKEEDSIKKYLTSITNMLQKDSQNVYIMNSFMILNLVLKNYSQINSKIKFYDKIVDDITLNNEFEKGFLLCAYYYMISENYIKACEYIAKVKKVNLSSIKALDYMGIIKIRQKKLNEAVSFYEKAWEYSYYNSPEIAYKLSIIYIKLKKYKNAIFICNKIHKKYPSYPILPLLNCAKKNLKNSK